MEDNRPVFSVTATYSGNPNGRTAGPIDVPELDDVSPGDQRVTSVSLYLQSLSEFAEPVTIFFETVDGSATAGEDYAAVSGEFVVGSGPFGAQLVSVPVFSDDVVENNESFTLRLSSSDDVVFDTGGVVSNAAESTVRIVNDDTAIDYDLTGVSFERAEGDADDPQTLTLALRRAGFLDRQDFTRFTIEGVGDNPADGDDFADGVERDQFGMPTGLIVFQPGESVATLELPIAADRVLESDESFTISLSNSDGQPDIDDRLLTFTLLNDDEAPPDGTDGDDVIIGTRNDETINGAGGDDILRGGGGDDVLSGQSGADLLLGEDGDDGLDGGEDGDILRGGAGNDALTGGAGADTLRGGADDDLALGGAGDDIVSGDRGDDDVFGEGGEDIVRGGADSDLVYGGAGNDVVTGDAGGDRVFGGDGNDVVRGGAGLDFLQGEDGDDRVIGDRDRDILLGGDGDDVLKGGEGEDYLEGGAGDDTLWGGNGFPGDVFVFEPGGGFDIVRDFTNNDKLDVSAFGFASVEEVVARSQNAENGVLIDLGSDASVLVRDRSLSELTDDFVEEILILEDDLKGDFRTTGEISRGETLTGSIDHGLDQDWYRIELDAGETIQISLRGGGFESEFLEAPVLGVYSERGRQEAEFLNETVDGDIERSFTASVEGDYYLSVGISANLDFLAGRFELEVL